MHADHDSVFATVAMVCYLSSILVPALVLAWAHRRDLMAYMNLRPGKLWGYRTVQATPFGRDIPQNVVQILEVKDGWVRYRLAWSNAAYQNLCLKKGAFLSLYAPEPTHA